MLVTREMMDAVHAAIIRINGVTPESYDELVLARTARYFMLMDYSLIELLDKRHDDSVYQIYYAYLIDTGEGPIEFA